MPDEIPEQIAQGRIEEAARTGAKELDLSSLKLSALPPEIGQLENLQQLNLAGNQLTALPPEIGQVQNLHRLDLGRNQLTALPPEIGQLQNLRMLDLFGNRLAALPTQIVQLQSLRELYVGGNLLTGLSPEIGQLTNLEQLSLDKNKITALPEELEQLAQLRKLYLHGNDALEIPPEILGPTLDDVAFSGKEPANPAEILAYYFRGRREQTRPLNEAKILLVGQGGVGKTSLVKRLVDDEFDPEESKTQGINIRRWQIPGKDEAADGEIRLNIWDFGGQEIMHATHQFFLTKRSLYLLVLDARKGENEGNIHYWLRIIQSYGADSPVLIVINQNEPPNQLDLNETRLRRDYRSNVVGFLKTSCQDGTGIAELRAAIQEQVHELPHVYDKVPVSYFTVKEALEAEARKRNFIDIGEYRELCSKNGVNKEGDQNALIRFLHDLGNVLNFDDPENPYQLRDTKVLNPEWVTGGVYKIINNHALTQQDGVLEASELGGVLGDPETYPADREQFILDMMLRFELCFAFPDSEGEFLIPELLRRNEPELNWEEKDALNFQYHYTILPEGIIPRFIVRTHHNLTDKRTYWQSGVVLNIDGCKALVRGDTQAGKVYISIQGPVPVRRRNALAVIRDEFRQIHATIPKIGAEEQVPLADDPGVVVGYQHLLDLEEDGTDRFRPERAGRQYSVQELLSGIEDKEKRLKELEKRRGELERRLEQRRPERREPTPAAGSDASQLDLGRIFKLLMALVLAMLLLLAGSAIVARALGLDVTTAGVSVVFTVVALAFVALLIGKLTGKNVTEIFTAALKVPGGGSGSE